MTTPELPEFAYNVQPHLSEIDGFLSVTVTLPLSSITVKNPSGSVRVDAPEAGE